MNRTIKILLLVVAILLSIGGIMYYYKTVVEPPQNLRFSNQYVAETKRNVALFDNQKDSEGYDSLYNSIFDEIMFFSKENRLNEQERDALMDDFANTYVPKFIAASYSKFEASAWDSSDHNKMLSRIKELRSLTINGGAQQVIQGDYLNSIEGIEQVIDQYNSARSVARSGGYHGLKNAITLIEEANRYASMKYLCNCVSLVADLNALPGEIEAAHFRYLASQVNSLYYWEGYSKDEYETLSTYVYEKINEYDNNASRVYGTRRSIDGLKRDAGRYYNQAMTYYKDKE